MVIVRWVMVALSATLAVVLLAHGNVLIGGILMALAVTRVIMLVGVQQRRRRFRTLAAERRRSMQGWRS